MTIHSDKQLFFNQIKGEITELNSGDKFCNLTLKVGHEKLRYANLVAKKEIFDEIVRKYKIGDIVTVRFFVSSRYKHERWYTMCNVLEVI